jgi:membrane protease YdiL (CAAX protease family)
MSLLRSTLSEGWARLRTVAGPIAIGLVIGLGSDAVAELLVLLNLLTAPRVQWSVGVGIVYLWLLWRYLGGWGWPRSSSSARRLKLRARRLSQREWAWSTAAMAGSIVALNGASEALARLGAAVPGPTDATEGLSLVTILTVDIWRAVLSPAIVEEAGFRGFMQAPLERRYGPAAAILIVSAVFGLVHWWAGPPFFYFLMAALFGLLAYASRSILPGIVAHGVWNLRALADPWWDIYEPSLPGGFWILSALGGTVLALWALRGLVREVAVRESSEGESPAEASSGP